MGRVNENKKKIKDKNYCTVGRVLSMLHGSSRPSATVDPGGSRSKPPSPWLR
jgi:hypothetical protein